MGNMGVIVYTVAIATECCIHVSHLGDIYLYNYILNVDLCWFCCLEEVIIYYKQKY